MDDVSTKGQALNKIGNFMIIALVLLVNLGYLGMFG